MIFHIFLKDRLVAPTKLIACTYAVPPPHSIFFLFFFVFCVLDFADSALPSPPFCCRKIKPLYTYLKQTHSQTKQTKRRKTNFVLYPIEADGEERADVRAVTGQKFRLYSHQAGCPPVLPAVSYPNKKNRSPFKIKDRGVSQEFIWSKRPARQAEFRSVSGL